MQALIADEINFNTKEKADRFSGFKILNDTVHKKSNHRTTDINNRRYLGNKYKLLPFIKEIVDKHCSDIESFADICAGTGAVSTLFKNKTIFTNDILYSNYICHYAWFSNEKVSVKKISFIIERYNNLKIKEDNYMSQNFSETYFSKEVCRKIGYIRDNIEKLFKQNKINKRERAALITSLLYGMDRIANTCGHYDAYRKNGELNKNLELPLPLISNNLNKNNQCFNIDANELVKNIKADLVYIDPPYNSRQYCDIYHLIENVAQWNKPKVSGIARKMPRQNLKSRYCSKNAAEVFESLISNINAKYILLSYNNMANKGNARSNAKISDKDIMRILSKKGSVKVFSRNYKPFSAGKSDINQNEERLFLCICKQSQPIKALIQSPLNYTGGKFKLLPQILPLFPKEIDTFIDMFAGGGNVAVNVNCKKAILNDREQHLLYLFSFFRNLEKSALFEMIYGIINKYGLSLSDKYGYKKYHCNSASGLGGFNKNKFLKLRDDFNKRKNPDYSYYAMLYVLIVYSFNNQIRFNSAGKFNLPVGKRDFNSQMINKLSAFVDRLNDGQYKFTNKDFRDFDVNSITKNSFIYCDPPYLITCASYNERGGWTDKDEKDLLKFLDFLNAKKIRFALSNVLSNKGKENRILMNWLNDRDYRTIHLKSSYGNSNYHIKDKHSASQEVLIVNYREGE
ncbi:MAG: Dam family site-specific DNA-(adenine-N6)-methyltransferase [Elusimicrobiota bacterium]|jgi:adenine-specific DNA-methyltransferase|nr:Dam family site-specific DNA-(adenine-N6)-methyltransferase [Elusimicrobiota bacterium]